MVFIDLLSFQELVVGEALAELIRCKEIVVLAVNFIVALMAGGGGDGELEFGHLFQEVADDGGLASAGGGGYDDDFSLHSDDFSGRKDTPFFAIFAALSENRLCNI